MNPQLVFRYFVRMDYYLYFVATISLFAGTKYYFVGTNRFSWEQNHISWERNRGNLLSFCENDIIIRENEII